MRYKSKRPGGYLLSHGLGSAVSSAVEGLTSEFGMGSGVSPPLWPPGQNLYTGDMGKV